MTRQKGIIKLKGAIRSITFYKQKDEYIAREKNDIDVEAELIAVDLGPFVPINMIATPSGSTHFKIISAGAEIDFETEAFV